MSDEDFEPFVGGPPPDPSERTWRHPSELAAQANADAMDATRRGDRRFGLEIGMWSRNRSLGVLLVGSLGAAACLAAVAVLQQVDRGNSGLDPAVIAAGGVIEIDPLDGDGGASNQASTGTTRPIAAATTIPTPTTTPASISTLAAGPAVVGAADDHVVSIQADAEHIASGVVLDGFVLTSASAVGDRLSITIDSSTRTPALAYLVGIDPFSDLAVYRPSIEARSMEAWSAISLRVLDPDGPASVATPTGGAPTDEDPVRAAPGDPVFLTSTTPQGRTIDAGTIIDLDCEGETPSGQPLVGLIDTSVRMPTGGAGGLLVGHDGSPIGIVVESASSLASAVPIEDALLIAGRLTEQGWATETWIGFIGMDISDGVEVVDVASDGPAGVAGLRPGDIIAFLDGSPIDHMGGVTAGLRRARPGDAVVIVVERDGEFVSLRVIAQSYRAADEITEPVGG